MAFTLAQLQLVLTVHEHGSLGKACGVLNLTQPALSRNLRELEKHLGVPLFERHPSGLRPTQFCHAILPYAANMVQEAAKVTEEVRILAGESRRVLRIGTVTSATMTLVPALIEQLAAQSPDLRIKVVESISEVLIESLHSHDIDLALAGPIPHDDEIAVALDLGRSDTCTALIGTNHPLLQRPEGVSPMELLAQRWVVLPGDSDLRKNFERMMRDQQLPSPNAIIETRSVGLVRTLIARQQYIGWGPPSLYAFSDPDAGIVALDIEAFHLRLPFRVYRLRRAVPSPAARQALTILQRLATPGP